MLQGVWGVTGTGIPCFCREKHSASLWGEPASATGTGPGGLSPKITKAQPPRQWQCSCASDCAPSAPRSMGTSGTRCPNPTACCQEGNGCPSPTTRRDGAPGHPLTEVMEMSAICAFFFSPQIHSDSFPRPGSSATGGDLGTHLQHRRMLSSLQQHRSSAGRGQHPCPHSLVPTHSLAHIPKPTRPRLTPPWHSGAPHQLPPRRSAQHRAQLPNKVSGALNYPLTFQWGKLPVKTR